MRCPRFLRFLRPILGNFPPLALPHQRSHFQSLELASSPCSGHRGTARRKCESDADLDLKVKPRKAFIFLQDGEKSLAKLVEISPITSNN